MYGIMYLRLGIGMIGHSLRDWRMAVRYKSLPTAAAWARLLLDTVPPTDLHLKRRQNEHWTRGSIGFRARDLRTPALGYPGLIPTLLRVCRRIHIWKVPTLSMLETPC